MSNLESDVAEIRDLLREQTALQHHQMRDTLRIALLVDHMSDLLLTTLDQEQLRHALRLHDNRRSKEILDRLEKEMEADHDRQ